MGVRNYFKWVQIINAIPSDWKRVVRNSVPTPNTLHLDQHLNKGVKMIPLANLDSKAFYSMFIDKIAKNPTSQKYFSRLFSPEIQ